MDFITPVLDLVALPLLSPQSDLSSPPLRSPVRPPYKQPLLICSLSTPPSPQDYSLPYRILLPVSRLSSLVGAGELGGTERPPTPNEDPPAPTLLPTIWSIKEGLDIDDRQQMQELMNLRCSKEHYVMASEVIGIIVPALSPSPSASIEEKLQAGRDQATRLARNLARWCDLSQHPLCTLISTIVLLERLFALHPQFNESAISADTFLRLSFSSFLLALKTTCDRSFHNSTFVRYTPWSLGDINVMERELLGASKYDLYVSTTEFLHRAAGFWTQHLFETTHLPSTSTSPNLLLLDASSPSPSPPSSPSIGNLFLTQKRDGVEERGWKGGILHSPGKMGKRMNTDDGNKETVWHDGRLERTEGWVRSKTVAAVKKKRTKPRSRRATDGGFFAPTELV